MHMHFEKTINAKSDCSILSLSWMGKVPDEIPEDEGWKLNRTNYYQEGWLATGNVRGIVGVTFTTSHCKKNVDFPARTNYNLRGHRSEVILIKWNEPYQKLASCDSAGVIFVWIKYEGRWSIELINDRNTPVTHFQWSHDGRMALICYRDGFVLVGSVAGQRYWSSMLQLESPTSSAAVTSAIWSPDDQLVYFGTDSGQMIAMDAQGAMVTQRPLTRDGAAIAAMAWSCEKFKMEEEPEDGTGGGPPRKADRSFVLAVCLQNGDIYLLKTFDDFLPIRIVTGFRNAPCMEWSNSGEFLAVAGVEIVVKTATNRVEYQNFLKFYNDKGILLYRRKIPFDQAPVSCLTWGHNDKRLFVATGAQIHIVRVSRRIASLQLLCRLRIGACVARESQLPLLPLPAGIRNSIASLFVQTIRCCVPDASALREFVSRPPVGSVRLHCTMIRHDEDSNQSTGNCYTLYLEYLGGLVPLLKGKRTSKIRPEFVIFDPQVDDGSNWLSDGKSSGSSSGNSGAGALSDSSDSDAPEPNRTTFSPRMPRKRKKKKRSDPSTATADPDHPDLTYVDTLPERVPLVEVTSNIWGTKFKIYGPPTSVPTTLGQVTYKTSLLHLQPRQMTLIVAELTDDFPLSEDEDDAASRVSAASGQMSGRNVEKRCPPIAPAPPGGGCISRSKSQFNSSFLNPERRNGPTIIDPEVIVDNFRDVIRPAQVDRNSNDMGAFQSCAGPSSGDSMMRSCSVGYLDAVDAQTLEDGPRTRRLVLVGEKSKRTRERPNRRARADSVDLRSSFESSEVENNADETEKPETKRGFFGTMINLERLIGRLREEEERSKSSPRMPRSSPSSPAPTKKGKRPQSASPIRKNLLSSPFLNRKSRKNKLPESSDDEITTASGDEISSGKTYRDLETFQKAQLRQKLKRGKIEPNGNAGEQVAAPQRREFVMHNKAPMWNENSQVYQLDFGGRVTQESAKNFQIEFRGKQAMQFGRIDGNAYTLDFQYPFTAIQAFAVALANVTQRLK